MNTSARLVALLFLLAGAAFVVVYFLSGDVLNLAAAAVLFAAGTVWGLKSRKRVPPN